MENPKKYRKFFIFALLAGVAISFLIGITNNTETHTGGIPPGQNMSPADKSYIKEAGQELINGGQPGKAYSLANDLKYEKMLIIRQRDKLTGKVDMKKVGRDLKSRDYQIRIHSIEILGYFPENEFIPLIEKILASDSSAEVRCQCARSLKMVESKRSIPQLVQALSDPDANVRIYSALALAYLGEKVKCSEAVNLLWDNGSKDAPHYSCHQIFLYLNTPEAVDKLKSDLKNSDRFIAMDAAIILSQMGHYKETFPFLETSLKDENNSLKRAAMRGLAYIGDRESLKLIKSMESDPDSKVRERASSILRNFENNPFTGLE